VITALVAICSRARIDPALVLEGTTPRLIDEWQIVWPRPRAAPGERA